MKLLRYWRIKFTKIQINRQKTDKFRRPQRAHEAINAKDEKKVLHQPRHKEPNDIESHASPRTNADMQKMTQPVMKVRLALRRRRLPSYRVMCIPLG